MAKKRKQLQVVEEVEIEGIAAEGKAIVRVEDRVVFVPFVVPGDIVDLQLYRKKKNYAEGRVMKFHHYSTTRIEPVCEHFGICGGCKWQMLPYEKQLEFKQQQVIDNLTRIGKVELPKVNPILGAKQTEFYRNKLEFTFSDKAWLTTEEMNVPDEKKQKNALGFHIPKMFDKVLQIEKCYLQTETSNEIRLAVHAYCQENKISYFNLRGQFGMMRNLIIRTSTTTGELMVIVSFYEKDEEVWNGLLQHIADKFPQITSLLYVHNAKGNDTIFDQEIKVFKGLDYMYETMEDLKFKIGPKSFYQTNSLQAYELYKLTRDFADLKGEELIYDLYTGTGTIANFIAKQAKQVIGIEFVPEAIEDAKNNAILNNIGNCLFYAGDMKDLLNQTFIEEHGKPDVIITDPPRAGMHVDVVKTILFADPKRIVYVSCNPATQARDLLLLSEKYKVTKVQTVDMFPHTQHVENIVLLEKI